MILLETRGNICKHGVSNICYSGRISQSMVYNSLEAISLQEVLTRSNLLSYEELQTEWIRL